MDKREVKKHYILCGVIIFICLCIAMGLYFYCKSELGSIIQDIRFIDTPIESNTILV